MAADYIKSICTVQPEGPYFLGGYSFGGIVAFEAAQQLTRQGAEVAFLALLDPPGPWHGPASSPGRSRLRNGCPRLTRFRAAIQRHWQHMASLGPHAKFVYV